MVFKKKLCLTIDTWQVNNKFVFAIKKIGRQLLVFPISRALPAFAMQALSKIIFINF